MRRSLTPLAAVTLLLAGAAAGPAVYAREPGTGEPGTQEPAAPAPAQTGAQETRPPEPRSPQSRRPPETRAAQPPAQEPPPQPLYVIEQLVVGLYSTPDVTGERVTTVKSGDRLEVLERAGEQVRVRTAGGREGWIRTIYLQAAEPLRPQLLERTAEVARLKEEVSRLEKDLDAARSSASVGSNPAPTASAGAPAPTAGVPVSSVPVESVVTEPQRGLFGDGPEAGLRRVWPWALGAALVALCIGFALGVLVLDRRIRRKYGGLRIY